VIRTIRPDVEDESLVLQTRGPEIQEQASSATRDAEIVDQLRHVVWTDGVQSLHFNQHVVEANEVDRVEHRQEAIA